MIQDAWGWCTGMTQRDGMEREVGRGSGWGTRVHPWWIHVDVWQNQYSIVKQKKKRKKEIQVYHFGCIIAQENEAN